MNAGDPMSGFEFLFTFYSLLLGLAVANIATDFADMWRQRHTRMAGTSTVLLGLFILLSVAQQWISFWAGREILVMGPTNLLVCIAIAFPYIFASQAMFPAQHDGCTSLEDYYMAHSRVLFGVLLIPTVVTLGYNLLVRNLMDWPDAWFFVVRLGIPMLLMAFRIRWLHRTGLVLLIAALFVRIYA